MVSDRNIGFVHAGQKVEIKADTFNFTRYGPLHGEVINLSSDAIVSDKQPARSNDRTADSASNSEPRGTRACEYAARVSLDRTDMQVGEKRVKLSLGMAVTVEIKTASRIVLSYLLSRDRYLDPAQWLVQVFTIAL